MTDKNVTDVTDVTPITTSTKKEEKPKITYIARKELKDSIIEEVLYNGKEAFFERLKDSTTYYIHSQIEVPDSNELLLPAPRESIPYLLPILDDEFIKKTRIITIADGSVTVDNHILVKKSVTTVTSVTTQELVDMMIVEADKFWDMDEQSKQILIANILFSYQQHKSNSTGYIFLTGGTEEGGVGKSRVINVFHGLCYRGMRCSLLRSANIYRFVAKSMEDEFQCTLLEDELDFNHLNSDDMQKFKLYRGGYERGNAVARESKKDNEDYQQKYFYAGCLKVFAYYTMPKDKPFQSRCTEIPMIFGIPSHDEILLEDYVRWQKIKMYATLWRMQSYWTKLEDVDSTLYCRFKLKLLPTIRTVVGTSLYEPLIKYAEDAIIEKQQQIQSSLSKNLLDTIITIGEDLKYNKVDNPIIWNALLKRLGCEFVEDYQSDSVELDKVGRVSKKQVSWMMATMFKGKQTVAREKDEVVRRWTFDKDFLYRLRESYNVGVQA